jgi:hypothetical protein
MATFSDIYPTAYHVFPLHAAKRIWGKGMLQSKQQLAVDGFHLRRRTTAAVDQALGFLDFVHFYLPRGTISLTDLPILYTQLKNAAVAAFPHVVLSQPTSVLDDNDCILCNWNIAVGRPNAPELGIKPGNWTRGTPAAHIAGFWAQYRQCGPSLQRCKGYWHPNIGVPILAGNQIDNYRQQRLPFGRRPELLLRTQFVLAAPARLYVFSSFDENSLQLLGPPPGGLVVVQKDFDGYTDLAEDRVAPMVRAAIEEYFATSDAPLPVLDYDARR